MTRTEIVGKPQTLFSSWLYHWWPVLALLLVFGGGIYAFSSQKDEKTLELIRFVLDGVVAIAIVIYVVYTHDLAKSSHIMADANLEMVKSMRSQSKQWVKDSKKQEYRTLLDTLGATIQEIIQLKFAPTPPLPKHFDLMDSANAAIRHKVEVNQRITAAFLEAGRVLGDRLFIDDVLKKHDVIGEWRRLERMADERPGVGQPPSARQETFSVVEFQQAWDKLAGKIRDIARQDLEAD